jgi:hypothetical protein
MKLIRVKCSDAGEFVKLYSAIDKLLDFNDDGRIKDCVSNLKAYVKDIERKFNPKQYKIIPHFIFSMKQSVLSYRKRFDFSTDFNLALLNIMDEIDEFEKVFFKQRADWQ